MQVLRRREECFCPEGVPKSGVLFPQLLILLVVSFGVGSCDRPKTQMVGGFEEQELMELRGASCMGAYLTQDGEHWVAAVRQEDGPCTTYCDGRAGQQESFVGPGGFFSGPCIEFSDNGSHHAYIGHQRGREYLVVDDKQGPTYDRVLYSKHFFSQNGERVAYAAERDSRWYVMIDGTESGPWDELGPPWLEFSPDSKHLAYAARSGSQWYMVIDGQPGPAYRKIYGDQAEIFSADGAHYAYGASAAESADEDVMVVDGRQVCSYSGGEIRLPPFFSPDSKHVAFVDPKDGTDHLVLDGVTVATSDFIDGCFSPDNRVAYRAKKNNTWRVVFGTYEGPKCDDVTVPTFSADGNHFAYAAKRNGRWSVIVDGKESATDGEHDWICRYSLLFSQNAKQFSYIAWDAKDADDKIRFGLRIGGEVHVVINGRSDAACDDTWPNGVSTLGSDVIFSPDSVHVAYGIQDGIWGYRYVLDGVRGQRYDEILKAIKFSVDGKHTIYSARAGDSDEQVIVDGKASPGYERILDGPIFDSSGAVVFLVRKEGVLARVKYKP